MARMKEGITRAWMTIRRDAEGLLLRSLWHIFCGYGEQMVRHYGCLYRWIYPPGRQEAIF